MPLTRRLELLKITRAAILLAIASRGLSHTVAPGPFEANWKSLAENYVGLPIA